MRRLLDVDAEFLAKLQRIAEDWRYSNEFVGLVVRYRWPAAYPTSSTPPETPVDVGGDPHEGAVLSTESPA